MPPSVGLPVAETAAAYFPRHPEESILNGVVAKQLGTFLERQDLRSRLLPRFVERELRSFLDCGILAKGFLLVSMPYRLIAGHYPAARPEDREMAAHRRKLT